MLYFDHNATSPMHPEARKAWLDASSDYWLNPAGPYRQAAAVKVRLESARSRLADILGCGKDQVVFNSGATEGNNTALSFFNQACPARQKILVSALEHPSVIESARLHPGDQDHVDVFVDEQFATIGHNPTTVWFSDLDLLRPVDNQRHRHDVVAEADPLEMKTATTPQAHEPDPQSMHR